MTPTKNWLSEPIARPVADLLSFSLLPNDDDPDGNILDACAVPDPEAFAGAFEGEDRDA